MQNAPPTFAPLQQFPNLVLVALKWPNVWKYEVEVSLKYRISIYLERLRTNTRYISETIAGQRFEIQSKLLMRKSYIRTQAIYV
jgi:hypothetical protein